MSFTCVYRDSLSVACFRKIRGACRTGAPELPAHDLETPDIKGVIIDVRDNGGGYLADMQEILAPMIDTDLLIGYTRVKEGLGRLDYGPWVPCILSPAENHRKVDAPIVVLANLYSVSMSEMTCMAVSVLPNGCVVGERTSAAPGRSTGITSSHTGGAGEFVQ